MMYVMRKQLTPDQIEEVFRKLSLIFEFAVQSATAESIHADYIMTRNLSLRIEAAALERCSKTVTGAT